MFSLPTISIRLPLSSLSTHSCKSLLASLPHPARHQATERGADRTVNGILTAQRKYSFIIVCPLSLSRSVLLSFFFVIYVALRCVAFLFLVDTPSVFLSCGLSLSPCLCSSRTQDVNSVDGAPPVLNTFKTRDEMLSAFVCVRSQLGSQFDRICAHGNTSARK